MKTDDLMRQAELNYNHTVIMPDSDKPNGYSLDHRCNMKMLDKLQPAPVSSKDIEALLAARDRSKAKL